MMDCLRRKRTQQDMGDTMLANRLDMLHGQLASLLESAQYVLADSSPAALMNHQAATVKTGVTTTTTAPAVYSCLSMQAEIRTLEFWRSIIAECVATFFYVVIVCSITTASTEHTMQINTALASGLAAAALTAAFARVSGAHLNPAVTTAMMFTRQLSPLRAILYICAQCGGGIAGAALVLGVYSRVNDPALQTGGGAFGMEFVLTFLIVYAYCASRAEHRNPITNIPQQATYTTTTAAGTYNTMAYGTPAPTCAVLPGVKPDPVTIGLVYAGCMVAWKGSLNPARALGSAFVSKSTNRFDQHWVFWVGPMLGAITGAFAYEYIFNPRRKVPFNFGSAYNTTTTNMVTNTAIINGMGMMPAQHPQQATMHGTVVGTGGLPPVMRHHPDEQMSIRSCEDEMDMLDDLERAKQQQYKSNIMQDFNERNSTYSSSALMRQQQQAAYGKNYRYGEPMYGDNKSMYGGHGMNNYDNKSIYDGYGSKSMYNGYDGGTMGPRGGMPGPVSSLRRSRSIHESAVVGGTPGQQRAGLGGMGGMGQQARRRNPYDYLPDEPHMTSLTSSTTAGVPVGQTVAATSGVPGAVNKPDIMQSVDGRLDSSGDTGRAMMNRSMNATTAGSLGSKLPVSGGVGGVGGRMDAYPNDRMDRNGESAYHTRMTNGQMAEDIYDYGKQQPRRKQLPILPDRPHPYNDQDDYANRNRVRMGSTARTDYYPETGNGVVDRQQSQQPLVPSAVAGGNNAAAQYSASYSQQNGCSIGPNPGAGITY